MGILDSKTRIMDTILTLEGRRQIATGELRAEYYSFSDSGAFYVQDTALSGAIEAADRIYLEASSLPQDMIAFEANDAGKLMMFPGSSTNVANGQIFSGRLVTGSNGIGRIYTNVSGVEFSSLASDLLDNSLNNFKKLTLIGSPDLLDENRDQFLLDQNTIYFTLSNDRPISRNQHPVGNIETTERLFQDKRLSHIENFKFLPPVNKPRTGYINSLPLGRFQNLGQRQLIDFSDVIDETSRYEAMGFSKTIRFYETSRENNLFCQMFELSDKHVVKLDVIDFGLFNESGEDLTVQANRNLENSLRPNLSRTKHVFFVGKIFKDTAGANKFINLFTLIFGND